MYCPRCGQQLASEIRFCSRCGLPLSVVTEIVANDGMLPVLQAASALDKDSSPRQGIRLGAKLIFLSIVLGPLCLGLSIWVDNPSPLIAPVTVFLVGFFWLIYSRFFGEEPLDLNQQNKFKQRDLEPPRMGALPPQKNAATGFNVRAVDTGEFIEPPSVTDHTTRLIK
jgi:zinc-ribbon domain